MENATFIPSGAASFHIDYAGPPKDFHFLLLPKMTMLAFSAAIEPLRVANQVTKKELYRWYTLSENGQPITCSNNVKIVPDFAMIEIPNGSYTFVCSGIQPAQSVSDKVFHWANRQRAFGGTLGGICTGAFLLAKCGILADKRFTLHWENQPAFIEKFPDLLPTPNLYEDDNGLLTCGGGNAATDMILDIIEKDHGKELAIIVADMCIHARSSNGQAPQKSAYSVALGSRNQRLLNAMQFMQSNLEDIQDMSEVAENVNISSRQLERLFKKYVKQTPNEFFYDLRIARAHALLNETNMSVTEIANAAGFNSSAQLAVRFKQKFGVSPNAFRKGWSS